MNKIGCGAKVLFGYVKGERYTIELNPQQIAAFIMQNQFEDTTITNVLDLTEITTIVGGFIMYCADQEFLRKELLPVLAPIQMGEAEAPEFVPLADEDDCF